MRKEFYLRGKNGKHSLDCGMKINILMILGNRQEPAEGESVCLFAKS